VISKRTKINVSKLAALEKNDVKNLPTGLYLFSAGPRASASRE